MSRAVSDEYRAVLDRPKIRRVVSDLVRDTILDQVTDGCVWLEPSEAIEECRDAKDNKYLELAWAGQAAALMTGDADLLVLHPWRGIPILNAADFLARFAPE